ncbi:type I restriction endonuclease subunit R [Candidatus Accumulibacter phosphatis]|jgi:type I restriction enzyme R subunit|uniref:Type I restriction enzyme endonuclease subunit n=1 Tax=Candidatus Accumulibacter phosphatis TaxID=327160 RepID=A0ABX1U151_9PROT|nr:type I restriction endonuclease subunit R [Candidatus Accumulibacter phosphatis]NMQ29049.1 type I restriction endonuclease subunit R [Candidatus Accumulibacter phosphatis]
MLTEQHLEQLAITWFQDTGWEFRHGPDIAPDSDTPERTDYRHVLLPTQLREALRRLNPDVPTAVLDEVAHHVAKPDHPSLIQSNRAFHEALIDGVPVEVEGEGGRRGDRVRLIDFENPGRNRFLVVNQFTIQGSRHLRRPDLVCFINGLPIAVIELKNAAAEQADIWSAFNQLQTYKEEIADLFVFNEALVISDGLHARVGSLTASRERYLPWRTLKNENDRPLLEFELEKVVRGFFFPDLLLDYLRYFVLFETFDGKLIKKIAAYHQFHAVREAVRVTIKAATMPLLPEGLRVEEARATYGKRVEARKGGIVWHTQGSGKSISMLCFAAKLMQQPEMQNPTLVVVTDRNDLDGQLFQTFAGARSLLKEAPQQAADRDELRALLDGRPSGGIIFTTVQKFVPGPDEEAFPLLSARTNIVVIADEAHRSQYGFRAVLDRKTGKYRYGFAKHLRDALKNATFVGFTGTPVESTDKDTRAVFGDYVSIYDIQDAVDDGATVPIYYESRLARLDLEQAAMEQLNSDVEEVFEDEEDVALREAAKTRWAALEKLVGAQPRIDQVAADIVQHFEVRISAVAGKGMIVGMSREICARIYQAMVMLRPEWHSDDPAQGAIKVVMTGSAADGELLRPHIHNGSTRKLLEKRFKDANDGLQLVIVRDMWLTGFDVPCLHTMYVDKPMRDHNLMQAIARVNRVFRDKEGGLVVDYIGIAAELRKALKAYTESRGKGQPTLDAAEALAKLKELMEVARGLLHGFDFAAYPTQAVALLLPAANFVLGQEEGKKRWFDVVLAISKAFSLCGTLDEALVLREEIAFFQAIKAVIAKATTSQKKLSEDRKNAVLKQILDNAVVAKGVEDIFKLAGLDRPDIGILSDAFLEEVRNLPQRNFAVELLQKLLNDEVKSRSRTNVVLERKFSERLQAALNRYRGRAIESAQVIEELIAMAREFRAAAQRGDALGLNQSELAFYDALADNESAVREMGDEILKKIAHELTEKLRNSASVDWQKRDSVRARLRNLVRITLRRYKYPPERQEEAIRLVLEQAERLSDEWTRT